MRSLPPFPALRSGRDALIGPRPGAPGTLAAVADERPVLIGAAVSASKPSFAAHPQEMAA